MPLANNREIPVVFPEGVPWGMTPGQWPPAVLDEVRQHFRGCPARLKLRCQVVKPCDHADQFALDADILPTLPHGREVSVFLHGLVGWTRLDRWPVAVRAGLTAKQMQWVEGGMRAQDIAGVLGATIINTVKVRSVGQMLAAVQHVCDWALDEVAVRWARRLDGVLQRNSRVVLVQRYRAWKRMLGIGVPMSVTVQEKHWTATKVVLRTIDLPTCGEPLTLAIRRSLPLMRVPEPWRGDDVQALLHWSRLDARHEAMRRFIRAMHWRQEPAEHHTWVALGHLQRALCDPGVGERGAPSPEWVERMLAGALTEGWAREKGIGEAEPID